VTNVNSNSPTDPFLPSPPVTWGRDAAPVAGELILVVDDDRMSRELHGAWLRHQGYRVRQADGPVEADRLLAQEDFSLILADICMPGNTRLEWVDQLLRSPHPPPIVLLTGHPNFETACQASNLSVAGYLVKPPDFELLGATLQRVIAGQRQRKEFLALSGEILGLLSTRGANDRTEEDALVERLVLLARQFVTRPTGGGGGASVLPSGEGAWRGAIEDTIAVIEKTKDSFRSKDLGQLRVRLQGLLDRSGAGAGSANE